jgi:hypothetical protein
MLKKTLFGALFLVGLFSDTMVFADPEGIKASAIVHLGNSPASSEITVFFDRNKSEEPALLVTSINLTHKDAPKRVDRLKVTPVSNYVSLLTGWFVVQQQSQELWIGITLPRGENHGEITLNIPGMLHLISDYPELYELSYFKPVPMLSELAASAASAKYAKLESIRVSSPKWGEVVRQKSSGWKRIHRGYYTPDLTGELINVLTIKKNLSAVADWLKNSLAPFSGGLSVAMIAAMVLFGMQGKINNKHRYLSLAVVIVSVAILIFMSGEWPPNIKVIFFDGAHLLGFIIPFIMVVILPTPWTESIRQFFLELRNA